MLQMFILLALVIVVLFFIMSSSIQSRISNAPGFKKDDHVIPPENPEPARIDTSEYNNGKLCSKTYYGCCTNGNTPAGDSLGTNCVHPDIHV